MKTPLPPVINWVSITLASELCSIPEIDIWACAAHPIPFWEDGTGPEIAVVDSMPSDNGMVVRLSDVERIAPIIIAQDKADREIEEMLAAEYDAECQSNMIDEDDLPF